MSARQAAMVQAAIIGLCVLALLFVFQPFSRWLYGLGAGLVVLGGLIFNLVPLARHGMPAGRLVRAGIVVILALLVVVGLAIGSAFLYGIYLKSTHGAG
ncbi:MAG: hypothetical protein IRY94_05945 [Rhodospirillaceae bacterium]|nr:hypothetical protein [Rhodospirillaceae bacterium]